MRLCYEGHNSTSKRKNDLNLFCASLFFVLESGLGGSVLPLPMFSFESFELSECSTPLSLLLLD